MNKRTIEAVTESSKLISSYIMTDKTFDPNQLIDDRSLFYYLAMVNEGCVNKKIGYNGPYECFTERYRYENSDPNDFQSLRPQHRNKTIPVTGQTEVAILGFVQELLKMDQDITQ